MKSLALAANTFLRNNVSVSVKGDQRATLLLYCPWNRRVARRHSIRCDEDLAGGKAACCGACNSLRFGQRRCRRRPRHPALAVDRGRCPGSDSSDGPTNLGKHRRTARQHGR